MDRLLVATRKGAWFVRPDGGGLQGPHFFGSIVDHVVLDPRDRRTMLAGVRTGHLGPTVFRSTDAGTTWHEAKLPPAFPAGRDHAVAAVFWLTPGHRDEPETWYAGTAPHGLFRSEDGGITWDAVRGFLAFRDEIGAIPGRLGETPGGELAHSVLVDPRDPRHLYIGLSIGGFFESVDRGESWRPLNRGVAADFLPGEPEYGHDPHCVVMHPARPDRLYQQNHCGIYRLDRPGERWERIGDNMPREIGDIGFPIAVHPRDPDTAWVFPMDGTSVWPRTSPGGRPAVYRTRDAGRTWERHDRGLPCEQGWFTVLRQALAVTDDGGLFFGTTSGEIWGSADEGESWGQLAAHLPAIVAVEPA